MDFSLFQNCPSLSLVMLDCLCCFHLVSDFRSVSTEHIFWHGRPCQKLCYHQHSCQFYLTTQVPPLRQSRNTFRVITVTLLFLISGKQNVRLFRETWHPMDTPADGSLPQRIPWATAASTSLQP